MRPQLLVRALLLPFAAYAYYWIRWFGGSCCVYMVVAVGTVGMTFFGAATGTVWFFGLALVTMFNPTLLAGTFWGGWPHGILGVLVYLVCACACGLAAYGCILGVVIAGIRQDLAVEAHGRRYLFDRVMKGPLPLSVRMIVRIAGVLLLAVVVTGALLELMKALRR